MGPRPGPGPATGPPRGLGPGLGPGRGARQSSGASASAKAATSAPSPSSFADRSLAAAKRAWGQAAEVQGGLGDRVQALRGTVVGRLPPGLRGLTPQAVGNAFAMHALAFFYERRLYVGGLVGVMGVVIAWRSMFRLANSMIGFSESVAEYG